jgi:uncharacterized YccA/Bax inhibitor family protein
VRSTSNPAFRNLPTGGFGGGYAGFQNQPQAEQGYGGGYMTPPAATERPMTVDDVVSKTAITVGLTMLTGVITSFAVLTGAVSPWPPLIAGGLIGFIISLVIIFKQMPNPGLVLTYAAAEGVFLGAITGVFEAAFPGIAVKAILGTGLVFAVMLFVYKTGAVRVTPKLTKWVIGAGIAAVLMMISDRTRPTIRPAIIGGYGLIVPIPTATAVMMPVISARPIVIAVLVTTSSTVIGRSPVVGGA